MGIDGVAVYEINGASAEARAAIGDVVFGVLLYGFFSFVWEPLHYIHLMSITLLSGVAFAILVSKFVFGTSPHLRFASSAETAGQEA